VRKNHEGLLWFHLEGSQESSSANQSHAGQNGSHPLVLTVKYVFYREDGLELAAGSTAGAHTAGTGSQPPLSRPGREAAPTAGGTVRARAPPCSANRRRPAAAGASGS